MEAKEFTAKRRQTVRLPDGSEFVIRRIGVMDVLVAGGNPDLMVFLQSNGRSPAKRAEAFAEKSKEMLERVQKDASEQRKFCEGIVRRGLVEPKIGGEEGIILADLTFEECDMLAGGILKFSGFTKEAAEAAAPLPGTGSSPETSMPAPGATDETPRVSSGQSASKPTPSTSPVPGQASNGIEGKPRA